MKKLITQQIVHSRSHSLHLSLIQMLHKKSRLIKLICSHLHKILTKDKSMKLQIPTKPSKLSTTNLEHKILHDYIRVYIINQNSDTIAESL